MSSQRRFEALENLLKVKVEGGYLVAAVSPDPDFPGVDVEFVPDDEPVAQTRPRALFEKPNTGSPRVLIWADKNNEDYTHEVVFNSIGGRNESAANK